MVTNKREEMEKLIATVGDYITVPGLKSKIPEAGIFDYSERSIKLYLDNLVDRDQMIVQRVKHVGNKMSFVYTIEIDNRGFQIRRESCKARNSTIYKELCDKFCEESNCDAYYKLSKKLSSKSKKTIAPF